MPKMDDSERHTSMSDAVIAKPMISPEETRLQALADQSTLSAAEQKEAVQLLLKRSMRTKRRGK